ncbi:hypothetical protein OAU79_00600, partial [bacterium]|nr:hypothetical protein [bacterium]
QANDAVERSAAEFDSKIVKLSKTIALLDLFKENSGIYPTFEVISSQAIFDSENETRNAISALEQASIIVFRKYQSSYAVFAGSDFDIEEAIQNELPKVSNLEVDSLSTFQPIMAKRHYHTTGTSRWFDVQFSAETSLKTAINDIDLNEASTGLLLLKVNKKGETPEQLSKELDNLDLSFEVILGQVDDTQNLEDVSRELKALENLQMNDQRLQGDEVARKEVRERIASLLSNIESIKNSLMESAKWALKNKFLGELSSKELNALASDICDVRFENAPFIRNELLNRNRPSASGKAAQNELMRKIIIHPELPRFGIEGYSSDRGVFESILVASNFCSKSTEFKKICHPGNMEDDRANFGPLWNATDNFLKNNSERPVELTELYEFWSLPPFGLKDGIKPLVALLYFLTSRENIAVYRHMLFQASFNDADVELLAANPRVYSYRWMELDQASKEFLSSLAELITELDDKKQHNSLTPLDVGISLIAIFDNIHPLTTRTFKLSKAALKLRDTLKTANDPNIIFDKLKPLDDEHPGKNHIRNLFLELTAAYNNTLKEMGALLREQLNIPNEFEEAIADIRERAINVKDIAGEFKIDAFVARLSTFTNSVQDIEGIISLASGKPTTMWIDQDIDRAKLEVARLARKFNELETFASLKNRDNKRSAFSLMQTNSDKEITFGEFSILENDKKSITLIAEKIISLIDASDEQDPNIILAALSEISAKYIQSIKESYPDE